MFLCSVYVCMYVRMTYVILLYYKYCDIDSFKYVLFKSTLHQYAVNGNMECFKRAHVILL